MSERKELSDLEGIRLAAVLAEKKAERLAPGSSEADESWLEVSKLREMLASMMPISDPDGFIIRHRTLAAALNARAIARAKELYRRYGREMSREGKWSWETGFHILLSERARTDLSVGEFAQMMSRICTRESSADPAGWSRERPLWGQCLVIALLMQDIYGGVLLRQSLRGIAGFEHFGSHYSNRLPDGRELDLTAGVLREQLGTDVPKEEYPREKALSYPDNLKGYQVLRSAFFPELIKWMKATYPEPQDD